MLQQPKAVSPANICCDPVEAYTRIAPFFERLAEERKPYLDSIDRLVLSCLPPGSRSLLDVGSGDGSRARRIARSHGITKLVLLEPSAAMQGDSPSDATVRTMRAEELHLIEGRFDVITCLWNVLGHIFPSASRMEVLHQFDRLVSPKGKIFVDVNHRYNARHYGALPTALRFLRDHVAPDEKNGDVAVTWQIEESQCTTKGHVFTDREFRSLSVAAGLSIEKRFVVDYATGQQRRRGWGGNLLYVLRRGAEGGPSVPATSGRLAWLRGGKAEAAAPRGSCEPPSKNDVPLTPGDRPEKIRRGA